MVIYSGSDSVALVFDDGPNPKVTPQILDVLKQKGVSANFFLIGAKAEAAPELVRRIAAEGHEIGNHGYTHKRLGEMFEQAGEAPVREEIEKADSVLRQILGQDVVRFFRPPYLDWNERVAEVARPLYGDMIIMAGTRSGDWDWGDGDTWDENDTEAIRHQATNIVATWEDAPNGTIIGLHDSAQYNLPGNASKDDWMNRALPTLEMLPTLIDKLQQRGLVFKKLGDMDLRVTPLNKEVQ